jgi:dihydropteroate synthase
MTQLVGILNLTPDSFSDGGLYDVPEAAYRQAEALIRDGADVLDIGAESTRPGANPLNALTEWQRLSPILPDIIALAHRHQVQVSLDTRHASTAAQAIAAGVDWINDVSCGASPDLLAAVAESKMDYVAMHSLGVPADKSVILPPGNPVQQVREAFIRLLERLAKAGINPERIILDPGLGFGKDAAQSLSLLWDAPSFTDLGCRLLIGHSRKSCFDIIPFTCNGTEQSEARSGGGLGVKTPISQKDYATLMASAYLMHRQIDYLRVHDIRTHATVRARLQPSMSLSAL